MDWLLVGVMATSGLFVAGEIYQVEYFYTSMASWDYVYDMNGNEILLDSITLRVLLKTVLVLLLALLFLLLPKRGAYKPAILAFFVMSAVVVAQWYGFYAWCNDHPESCEQVRIPLRLDTPLPTWFLTEENIERKHVSYHTEDVTQRVLVVHHERNDSEEMMLQPTTTWRE